MISLPYVQKLPSKNVLTLCQTRMSKYWRDNQPASYSCWRTNYRAERIEPHVKWKGIKEGKHWHRLTGSLRGDICKNGDAFWTFVDRALENLALDFVQKAGKSLHRHFGLAMQRYSERRSHKSPLLCLGRQSFVCDCKSILVLGKSILVLGNCKSILVLGGPIINAQTWSRVIPPKIFPFTCTRTSPRIISFLWNAGPSGAILVTTSCPEISIEMGHYLLLG